LKARPEELVERIEALQKQVREARKQGAVSSKADLGAAFTRLKEECSERDGVRAGVLDFPELDGKGLGELCDRARSLGPDLALALVGRAGDKVPFVVACGGRALEKGLKAGDLARVLAGELGGGGGGKPEKAQGQGLKPDAVEAALAAARAHLQAALGV
jgi:alanyl-tRNA synthetase